VKSVDANFGSDPIDDMTHFDRTSRWMEWSKNEFSHRLTPEPMPVGRFSSHSRSTVFGLPRFWIVRPQTTNHMIIDIRKDLPDFRAYLVERTAAYSRIAGNQPVSRIHFGF